MGWKNGLLEEERIGSPQKAQKTQKTFVLSVPFVAIPSIYAGVNAQVLSGKISK
ncbi:MAG: hypothetical protein WBM17_15265 [Anaerolineales bacterium]